VKPRCARGKREIGDADKIPVADTVVVLLQGIERTSQQTREPMEHASGSMVCKDNRSQFIMVKH
jgi:hypothetical protein